MNPLVMNAIADIDSLERLTLEAFTSSILLSLLSRMKSRPHIVTCLANHIDPYTSYAPSYPESIPMRFLHNLADGLREVTLAGVLPIMNSAIVCPHVEVLMLNDFGIEAEEWESIVHTFPNVRIFRATARVVPVFNASVPPRAGWPDLDMVQMQCPLPLSCHVRRVELERPRGPLIHHYPLPEILDTLRRVTPVALTSFIEDGLLGCVGRDLHDLKILRLVGTCVLPGEAENTLVSLHICVPQKPLLMHAPWFSII